MSPDTFQLWHLIAVSVQLQSSALNKAVTHTITQTCTTVTPSNSCCSALLVLLHAQGLCLYPACFIDRLPGLPSTASTSSSTQLQPISCHPGQLQILYIK